MVTTDGVWLSITDYSSYKKVSISTIRRHIKSNLLKYKEENGKYFIYLSSPERLRVNEESEVLKLRLENQLLKGQLQQIKEESSELRMLVDLYENKSFMSPPALPELR